MSIVRHPQGMRVIAAAVLGLCLAQAAVAAAPVPPPPDPEQLKLDGAIQGLKDEILSFNRDAQLVENDVLYPAHSRASIYLGVKIGALLMKTVSIAVDDRPAQTYTYSDPQARALLISEGLHRLVQISLEPGPHRLTVDYTAQYADADKDDKPVTGHYEAIFDKRPREAELELTLSRNSRFSEPQLRLRDRKVAVDEALPPPPKNRRPRRQRVLFQ